MELKNDLCLRGTLHSVDQYLNIKLHDVHVLEEEKYPHMVYCLPPLLAGLVGNGVHSLIPSLSCVSASCQCGTVSFEALSFATSRSQPRFELSLWGTQGVFLRSPGGGCGGVGPMGHMQSQEVVTELLQDSARIEAREYKASQ